MPSFCRFPSMIKWFNNTLTNSFKAHSLLIHSTLTRNMSYGSKAADRLAGKTALITGASSGIGQATAFELASAAGGNIKLVLSSRRVERLEQLKKDIESKFPNAKVLPLPFDLSKYHDVPAFVAGIPAEFAKVDILVNNAGLVLGNEKIGTIAQADIDTMFNTNVLGLIALTQAFVPKFRAQDSGDIVNVGSIAGRDPYQGGAIYCPTKAALNSFTHVLRKETIDSRIRVIEVQPGQVETEFSVVRNRGDKAKADAVYSGVEPLTADDVAEIIVFALTRRQNTVVAETLLFPSHQGAAQMLHRKN
jgi:3-hydroxy acid dehydrogenase/malonic semialdehyde reductase